MAYVKTIPGDLFTIDVEANEQTGTELSEAYAAAAPFPHCYIDDFLPREVIDYCLKNFPDKIGRDGDAFDRDQERYKASFNPDELEPGLRHIFYTLNSRPFVRIIENITGIRGLIPDPYFLGGGFHEIGQGGHLSMHADFNHHKPLHLERRVNVLIYLNDDWREEYGGSLELWDLEMKNKVQSIVPLANRMAMFSTTSTSWHGNPQPVAHPDGRTRKSIALYYYTATWSEDRASKTTQFRVRPGTEDKTDWRVKSNELIREWLPPVIARPARRIANKLTK